MAAVVLILTWACATGITTSASRMTWAFARDLGVPFSRTVKKVTKRTRAPVIAVGVVTLCALLLSLIYIGSPVAFNDVISLTITGFYGSYLVPSALLLYRRVKGEILPHKAMLEGEEPGEGFDSVVAPEPEAETEDEVKEKATTSPELVTKQDSDTDETHLVAYVPSQLYWGPWHIPGIWGIINNAYACVYMVFVIFWSVWPPSTPVDPASMNYSVLVTGGVILFSIFWYYVRGRKEYRGPLLERKAEATRDAGTREAVTVISI